MDGSVPQYEVVPDLVFESRGPAWWFQVATNGAVSCLSPDRRTGWRGLAPAAAIEFNLQRGQLAECKASQDRAEVTLTFRYGRLPVAETMTVRLTDRGQGTGDRGQQATTGPKPDAEPERDSAPAGMTIERVLHNRGQTPLRLHEVRMLAVDGGGVVFGRHGPADLRCGHVPDVREALQPKDVLPLPQTMRILGEPGGLQPALVLCDTAMDTVLVETSLRQEVFGLVWQLRARDDWRPGRPVLADYAAVARPRRRQPLMLLPDQRQEVSNVFYQVKAAGGLPRSDANGSS